MIRQAVAVAHPNVALSKYWGKRAGEDHVPAVPSLSVTLSGLTTRTRLRWDSDLRDHRFILDGVARERGEAPKVFAFLDAVGRSQGVNAFADVESRNDFPTASGLASSASGFAALALAGVRASGCDWDAARVADLARHGSASAARSLFGGFVELDGAVARQVAPADHLPLVVLVCITTEAPKAVSSSEGMRATLERSPYAQAWLDEAPRIHARLREALLERDFDRLGELAETSALAMHASALAAGIVYWNGATIDALAAVQSLRAAGTLAYATIDAGPHVKVLVRPADAARALDVMKSVRGVVRVLEARPGSGAALEHERADLPGGEGAPR